MAPQPRVGHRVGDALVVLGFGLLSAFLIVGVVDDGPGRARAGTLAVLHIAPLALRRRWPAPVLGAMAASALLTIPLGVPLVVLGPAVLVAVYTVGATLEPPRSRQALVGTLVVTGVVVAGNGMDAGTVVGDAVGITVAWWLGDRARRGALDTERERAAGVEAARRAAAAERLQIARELHDVVAHAMSVIAVQAGTGRFVADGSPDLARDALASIETTSRAALQEMRRLLSVLRDEDAVAGDLLPAPGLADVDGLVAATAGAGVAVDLRTCGDVVPLPSGVDLCAYRVVQEALTNVRKHARASRATVTIAYEPAALSLEIVDDGVGDGAPAGGGQGQVGMRERVHLYGGDVEVGPCAGGGYRVAARLPLAEGP
jgi:signal transduction histidine kinase